MDDRGYLAQALFDRLREGVELRVLGDTRSYPDSAGEEVDIAVPRASLSGMPRAVARFCHELDLQLVQLLRGDQGGWEFVFAWSDDVGRPRFLRVRIFADYCRGASRLLRVEELLAGAADIDFVYGVLDGVLRGRLADEWLSSLWHADPRAAMEQIARFWRQPSDIRLIAQAARHGNWTAVRSSAPRLRRSLRRRLSLRALLARLGGLAARFARDPGAAVAFVGAQPVRGALRQQVMRDLAPAFPSGLATIEHGFHEAHSGVDLGAVVNAPESYSGPFEETIAVDGEQRLPAMAAAVERSILRWLECRVERRYPDVVVGENPRAARLLQLACRARVPLLKSILETLLNCRIDCRISAPILMPYPFGIVVEKGVTIGRQVTVMQQATIGRKHPSDPGVPIIEDHVRIGAGARILGAVRVGRGATVGANAVVTRDVPSHCTVVGANRILGQDAGVAEKRRQDAGFVVNT
jgi:serine O-acetyltransferase